MHSHRALVGPKCRDPLALFRCYNSLKTCFAIHILEGDLGAWISKSLLLANLARHLHAAFDRNSQPK